MKYKVGDKVRVKGELSVRDGTGITYAVKDMFKYRSKIMTIKDERKAITGDYTIYTLDDNGENWAWTEEMLEPTCKYKVGDRVVVRHDLSLDIKNGVVSDMLRCRSKMFTITDVSVNGIYYKLDGNGWAWTDDMLKPVCTIDDLIPTPEKTIPIEKQLGHTFKDSLDSAFDAWKRLGGETTIYFENGSFIKTIPKEDKPMKFTFYVTEGTRVDKSCNGTIPTMTTTVEANGYSRTAPVGTATCDKADYDMRQGVLEALANMYCDGDFDKVYNKAVKRNELADKKKRTCKYCGKVFDTVEEREAEEAWHVERRKARHERYLLRKRAKEIAFEEQAQKLAKEMMGEQK